MLPRVVVHADWSTDPRKRWMATAALDGDVYRVSRPAPVEQSAALVPSAVHSASGGCAVLGFDFPIGVPKAYAQVAHIESFLDVLPELGTGRWKRFYDLASRPDEVSIDRPFYPFRPGGTLQAHLVKGIGVRSIDALLRRCDFGNEHRNKACALFWTLGGNQVGRAAISGWREVLVPAIRSLEGQLGVWPFHGELNSLINSRLCVIAETYPADACVQLGLPGPGRGWSKRNREDRIAQGLKLIRWGNGKAVDLRGVKAVVEDGFGSADVGEDQFDAVVGLLGMLAVILGVRSDGIPIDHSTRRIEGWILGQRSHG